MSEQDESGTYQYRAVFILGNGWRFCDWTSKTGAIEDIGVAKEQGAIVTAIERKDAETGQIERAGTPEDEWIPEEETDLKIREAAE